MKGEIGPSRGWGERCFVYSNAVMLHLRTLGLPAALVSFGPMNFSTRKVISLSDAACFAVAMFIARVEKWETWFPLSGCLSLGRVRKLAAASIIHPQLIFGAQS